MSEKISKIDAFISRPAAVIDANTPISANATEPDTFVVYGGQVAVGGHRITSASAALSTQLHYPLSKHSREVIVDDSGLIYDNRRRLVIGQYFSQSTMPALLKEAFVNGVADDDAIDKVKKEIRQNTGRLVSDITGRSVLINHIDGTKERFLPSKILNLFFETRQLSVGKRLCVRLENGLTVSLPSAIEKQEDIGDYEIKTLDALQTPAGLAFVLDALKHRPDLEVNLNIGTKDNQWVTAAGVSKVGDEIIFMLYTGAK